jgi:hypothetical protein
MKQTYRSRANHRLAERRGDVITVASLAACEAALGTNVCSAYEEGKGGSEEFLERGKYSVRIG